MTPTTAHLKALGYRLIHSVVRGVYIVVRPDGRVVPNSYAMNPAKSWALARDYIAREIKAASAPDFLDSDQS